MLTSSGDSMKEGMKGVMPILFAASVGMKSCLRLIAPLLIALKPLSSRDAADISGYWGKDKLRPGFELYEYGIVSAI